MTYVALEHMVNVAQHVGWGGAVKGKVTAALSDYLCSWLWRYSHVPHDLNVNDRMTKLGHLAGNKSKVSGFRGFHSPGLVKCLKIDNSNNNNNNNKPLKNPEPFFL